MKKVIVYATLFAAAVLLPRLSAATWTIEPAANNLVDELYPFLAVDGQSRLHIVYTHFEPSDPEIFYANNLSGAWQGSRVTDNSTTDQSSDILVKLGGEVHIAFQGNDGDGEAYHAWGAPGSWSSERVTDDGKNDIFPQVAIDRDGFLHMAYAKEDPSGVDLEIFYANNKTGHWVQEQVTFNTLQDLGASLCLDKAGVPHIAFFRGSPPSASIIYAKKTAGVWTEQVVMGPPTWYPALSLDKNDFAHIAYAKWDGADWEIYYANNVTGSWQESQVTSNSTNDRYNSICLDGKGFVHIAYLGNDGDDEVYYADNTAGVWQSGRVTDNTIADYFFGFHELAIDGLGFGHIVFWNSSSGNDDIYHAKSDAPIADAVAEQEPRPANGLVLHPNVPEPFFGATSINYELPSAGPVTIAVYDAAGARVRTLVSGFRPAGSFRTCWDGRTDQGTPAKAGVYFGRLVHNGRSLTEKLVFVR